MQWRGKDETDFTKGLEFTYDGVNRLKNALKPQTATYTYVDTESGINYDLNGNILALNRAGASVDNLTYSYLGNRLSAINDGSGNNTGVKSGPSSYGYDANGNMLTDGNRNATLTYNYLNLPKTVVVSGKTLTYDYDAAGNKHKYVADTLTVKYAGIFEYDANNAVKRVTISAGQVQFSKVLPSPASDTLRFDYTLKDHLGNVRVVFDEKGNILQKSDYYPFGLAISRDGSLPANARNGVNRYLYNEKEIQVGTGYLDYGARMYMPEIGRWGVVDPMSEKALNFSPYAYGNGNPINMIDSDGRYAVSVHYDITYQALLDLGYSQKKADLIAHYSSTYADHPSEGIRALDHFGHNLGNRSHLGYRKSSGINYNLTASSQEESNSVWHSMMSDSEADAGMTEGQATDRGLKFGWDNIFSQREGEDLGKLGQGLHALQDAIAHHGVKTNDHLGRNMSSVKMLINDMYGSTKEATSITKSALVVSDLLQGKKATVKDGETLNFRGMSQAQFKQVAGMLLKQGFQGTIKTQ